MEIGSSTSSDMVKSSQGLLVAALAKRQQVADGEAALKLLASATVPPATQTSSGSIGANINVSV